MNPLIQLKNPSPLILIALLLACLPLSPGARAVVPAPDGGYPGQNTAEGQSALLHLAGGTYNTALGWSSLGFNVTGNLNTGVGAATLLNNSADQNTAIGAAALLSNTTGGGNTATGVLALFSNTTGINNTAIGGQALFNNTSGHNNTANGLTALYSNTTGRSNTANGDAALFNNTGNNNTADGPDALFYNTTGSNNIAVGNFAGENVTTANNVICIGAQGNNVDNSCFIGNIFGATSSNGVAVFVNSNGRLGTMTSSARFKTEIKPMDKASEAIFSLQPVTFRYKHELDPQGIPQFGLVAEQVQKVNPDLVARDKEGKPYSVRYDQVNAMLLNEFLRARRQIDAQQKQIDALNAGLQKVSAQMEANKPVGRTVMN